MDKVEPPVKVYEVLLNLAHIVFTFIQILYDAWVYLRKKIASCHEVWGREFKCIDSNFKNIQKVPRHLTVILGPEEPSYKDLVNIVLWCTASGIPFVSFYDHNGILKKSEDKFFETLTEISGFSCHDGFWTKHEAPFNGYKNGFTRRIHIKVLSLPDGQRSLVDATKHFISSQSGSSNKLTIEQIDNYLSEKLGHIPDPDLAVYCGDTCATFGFLPWQIRVTEFVNLKSHHNVSVEDFMSILQFYSRCEQRHGK